MSIRSTFISLLLTILTATTVYADVLTAENVASICKKLKKGERTTDVYDVKGVIKGASRSIDGTGFINADLERDEGTIFLYHLADIDSISFNGRKTVMHGDTVLIRGRLENFKGTPCVYYAYLLELRKYVDPTAELIKQAKDREWQMVVDAEHNKRETDILRIFIISVIILLLVLAKSAISVKNRSEKDYLTGLYNRIGGEKKIASCLKNKSGVMCLIDIDKFKKINDSFGHTTGDKYIVALSNILKAHFGKNIVMRLGGDEFAIFAKEIDQDKLIAKVQSFFKDVENVRFAEAPGLQFSVSMGIANYEALEASSIDHLYSTADKALYESKKHTGCHYTIASEKSNTQHSKTLSLLILAICSLSCFTVKAENTNEIERITTLQADSICRQLQEKEITEKVYDLEGVITGINRAQNGDIQFKAEMEIDEEKWLYVYRLSSYDSTFFQRRDELAYGDTIVIRTRLRNFKGIPTSYYGYLLSVKKYVDPVPQLIRQAKDAEWQKVVEEERQKTRKMLHWIGVFMLSLISIPLVIWLRSTYYTYTHDYLTGLLNRHGASKLFQYRKDRSGYIVIFDVDKFKNINDTYGHVVGDQSLIKIAQVTKETFSKTLSFRLGGDEFGIIFTGETDEFKAKVEEMFIRIDAIRIEGHPDLRLSVSMGATYHDGTGQKAFDRNYALADQCLYKSKEHKGSYLTIGKEKTSV